MSGRTQIPGFSDLGPQELAIFDSDLRRISYMQALERDLSNIMIAERDTYLFAASIAKAAFRNLTFGGLLGGGGFNFAFLRPNPILSSVTAADGGGGGAAVLSWKRTFTTTGWQALFGKDTDQVSLGITGSSTTTVTTYQRVMLAVPYLLSTGTSPRFVEIRPRVLQTTYPVQTLNWLKMTDIYLTRLSATLLNLPNEYFDIEGNISTTGDDEPQLLGIQYVTFDYAVLES